MKKISREKAKKLGLKSYFTGKECRRGHVTMRFVCDKSCYGCKNENTKKWIAENREKKRDYDKEYIQKNRLKRNANNAKWCRENKEKLREKRRATKSSRRAAEGKYTVDDIKRMLESQQHECNICFVNIAEKYEIDHIVPLSKGGTSWPSNLQILCPTCNRRKGNR